MSDELKWRRLEFGEIIQAGDEIDRCSDPWRDPPKWESVHPNDIGQPAPDPQYSSHRQYRRRGEECDHEWSVVNESFDHEYGTEIIVFERCDNCDAIREHDPPRFEDDVI